MSPDQCPAATATAASDTTALAPFGFLVGGVWTSADTLRLVGSPPFLPTLRYEWAAGGRVLRVQSVRHVLDGTSMLNNEGFYYWRAERCAVTHVLVFPDGGRIEGDYEPPETAGRLVTAFTYFPMRGGASRWRSEIERIGPDRIREVASRWNGTAWQQMTRLVFIRSA